MTPHEINLRIQAHGKSLEGFRWIAAWHLSYILNMFLKKGASAVQPADLMGTRRKINLSEVKALSQKKWLESLGIDPDLAPEAEQEVPTNIAFVSP